eukprot:c6313_g1_i1.p1 GENE.c6313_g1_i1~~c6313_g1_i1.p1  ORF type:complete len:404 (+),score=90.29 c6313_g1_i1:39-1214(+)
MSGSEHRFWRTQPVPQTETEITDLNTEHFGPLETKNVADIKTEPYDLPAGFVWTQIDVLNNQQLTELYEFLNQNYVEDSDAMFRFDYSSEFLRWALNPPHQFPEWLVGVRADKTNKLLGFISAIPATLAVYGKTVTSVEINFLCVHKKLREKRLAPVLIREITRRVNLRGIFQAAYTAGVVVPQPVSDCRYYHRNLNPKKLIETNFTRLQARQTLSRVIKLYRLPEEPELKHIEPLQAGDCKAAHELLARYLTKFKLHPIYTDEEFAHWFLPRQEVISSFVIKNEAGVVTDLTSFYTLPSSVIGNPLHSSLKVAYSYYNVPGSVNLEALMKNALILATQSKHDVFNALNLMENEKVFQSLKFGKGDGELHYYLYNWKVPHMTPEQSGLVLL